tara:strand:- start:209 stop:475 length:267 start_codon:yes stop_codon:yes gene_type:complete
MTLRNEILPVRELKRRFVTPKYLLTRGDETTSSIEKTVIFKKGFKRVIGLRITDVLNSYYDESKVGKKFCGCLYNQSKYATKTEWVFE